MHKIHPIKGKSHLDELAERRENEMNKLITRSELLEHNPLLHTSEQTHPHADNENNRESETPLEIASHNADEAAHTMLSESRDCTEAVLENMQEFQNGIGNLFATQRRIAELWMETWISLMTPRW